MQKTLLSRQFFRLRWSAVCIVGLAYILSFFHRFAPATIASDLQLDFSASGAALGGLAATYFYVYMLMQIPTGILADTLGPRRVVAMGGVIAGLGSLLFGMADTLAMASVGRLLVGLGVSVTFISLLKLNAVWFHDRHFATMTGATVLIGNMGSLLAAAPLTWALGFVTWRTVFVMVGIFSLLIAVLSWWLVHDHPGKAGLPSMRELDGKTAHPPHLGHWYEGLLIVLKNRATWPGLWVNAGLAGSLFAFAGLWAVPFLRDVYGMDRASATDHTTLLLAGFAIGGFFIGTISDRMGRRKPVMFAAALGYFLCWLPLLPGMPMNSMMSHTLFFMMGICVSGFTLSWSCAKEVNPHALSGMATSVVNIGAFLGGAILQPLIGWAIDYSHASHFDRVSGLNDYQAGIAILAGFALMGLIATLFVRETNCRYVTI
ncbi:MAG: MFS transporter [Gallionellales bacterium 35-53-114]|jgi:sugar phosphate permease|nr:MAG: MFS transporter [Gallionellales bacterium 35-53-114]OYZ64852.1 MAG: MFS transporter [Gallionellales bacterium 24-53-125]OZB07610.1 MAG: MFS transporter [Gallionellales bacterium 39-52-133]HQS58703.1 MFS transporter [Gallionellaceae bacterium]HQS75043.1 MFS transporter [Gallionellaceae bacterium]